MKCDCSERQLDGVDPTMCEYCQLKQDRDHLELELHNFLCRYNRLEDIYKNMIEELQRLKE